MTFCLFKPKTGLEWAFFDFQYLDTRYLNSDSYAMLQYNWADDYGMMPCGDKDSYYTEKRKTQTSRRICRNHKKK